MRCMSLFCWLSVVGAGVLLGTGSAMPVVYRWKILSQATGLYVGVDSTSKAVLGDRSFEDATLFYLFHDIESNPGFASVSTTGTPQLYLNIDSETGQLQASPKSDDGSLKNALFKIVQPSVSDIQLVVNVTSCSGSGQLAKDLDLSATEEEGDKCTVECGIAFDPDLKTPVLCQDQKDDWRDLSFNLHLPSFFSRS